MGNKGEIPKQKVDKMFNSHKFLKLFTSQKKLLKKEFKSHKNKFIFYIATLAGILVFILSGLLTRGHSFYNLFIPDRTNFFMDFFNVLHSLLYGPYTYGFIYPPLPLMMYRVLLRLIPYDLVERGSYTLRAVQAGEIVFMFYMLLTLLVFIALIMEFKKGLKIEKYIFTFVMLFSAPFLFQFERANIIFVALLFLMFFVFYKDSKNPFIRELSLIFLAISAGIKLYPAVFGLMLLKEKRFNEFFRLVAYCLILFIVPFFFVGGINQLPVFLHNILYTSDYATNWGLGFSVNIQNIVRIISAFFGNFSEGPIFLGKIMSIILLAIGLLTAFISRSKWKTVCTLTLLMILVPIISFEYVLIFMVIPLILFLDEKRKKEKISDYIYLACFLLILIPLPLGNVDFINAGLGNPFLPLTFGVLLQNIALTIMMSTLIIEGIRRKL